MGGQYMGALFLASLFALASCASTKLPPPAVELRTVTVRVPVPVPCLSPEQKAKLLADEPARIAASLTGDARHDLDLVAAHALRLAAWGRELKAALC